MTTARVITLKLRFLLFHLVCFPSDFSEEGY